MRQIGSLENEQLANQFTDFLLTQGISAQSEQDRENWVIWIRDEHHVQPARDELTAFRTNPAESRFHEISEEARKVRQRQQQLQRDAAQHAVEIRGPWKNRRSDGRQVTIGVIVICAIVFITSGIDRGGPPNIIIRTLGLFDATTTVDRFAQLREGQLWRIFTPNLMHGDIVHIAFNMMWFLGFGTQIELRQGKAMLIGLILLTGIGTMGAELLLSNGFPIGMSGVVYGTFAYVWMRSRYDPGSGYFMPEQTVTILMIFFFVGWSGLLSLFGMSVANWGHTGGLVVGLIWGYVPTLFRRG